MAKPEQIVGKVVPAEIIHTKDSTIVAHNVIAVKGFEEEVLQVAAAAIPGRLLDPSEVPQSSSTIGINYRHPKSSDYFKDRRWKLN